jgi:thiol:disulfide interchange protein DsbA
MNRRDFSSLGLGFVALSATPLAHAQAGPAEGTHYQRLAQPIPMAPTGKVEVVEFFWYGCPHCFALEPLVEQWLARLPPDVNFRRAPAAFTPQYEFHQRVYFALEAMGEVATVHRKLFNAIHLEKKRLGSEAEVVAFVSGLGLDGAKFSETLKSFGVATKARQARQLAEGYRIDGVPAVGVQGRYITSAAMAGGNERVFQVVDHLVGQARKTLG